MSEQKHDISSLPVVFVGNGKPETPIQLLAREAGVVVNPAQSIQSPHPGELFSQLGLISPASHKDDGMIAIPAQPILITQPTLGEVELYGNSLTTHAKKKTQLKSSEYAKALVTPGIFLRDEYSKNPNKLPQVESVITDIMQVLQDPTTPLYIPVQSVFEPIPGKKTSVRNAHSGETHAYVSLSPSACEQAGMYICALLSERKHGPEVAEKIVSAYEAVLRQYRTSVYEANSSWVRMPELADSLLALLDTIPTRQAYEYQGMRFRIYDIFTQIDTSEDITKGILTRMDQYMGDYSHPLAYRCALDTWYRYQQGKPSEWAETQIERIEELKVGLNGSAQNVFDHFSEYERLAAHIVMEPTDAKIFGKVGVEIECGILPTHNSRVRFEDGSLIAPGWRIGTDPNGNREIRRERDALNLDDSYIISLINLHQFLQNYGTHIAGIHMNFDMSDFPLNEKLFADFFSGDEEIWISNKDNEHRNEFRAVFPLIAQRSSPNSLDIAAVSSIARFMGTAMQSHAQDIGTPFVFDTQNMMQVRTIFWAHISRHFVQPDVRFRALLALKHPMGLQSVNVHKLLDQFAPEQKDALVEGLLRDPGISMNQTIELLCLDASNSVFDGILSAWSQSENIHDINKLLSVSAVVETENWYEPLRPFVRKHLMENGVWRRLLHHTDERIVQRTIEYLTTTDATPEVFVSVLSLEGITRQDTKDAVDQFRTKFFLKEDLASVLIDCLQNERATIRKSAIDLLADTAQLSPEQFRKLARRLFDQDITVQYATAKKLARLEMVRKNTTLLYPYIRPLLSSSSQRQHVIAYTSVSNMVWDSEIFDFVRQHMGESITKKHLLTHMRERTNIPTDIVDKAISIGLEDSVLWHRASTLVASRGVLLTDAQIQRILSYTLNPEDRQRHSAIDMLLRVFTYTRFSDSLFHSLISCAQNEVDREYRYRLLLTIAQCTELPISAQQSVLELSDGSQNQYEELILTMMRDQRVINPETVDMYVNSLTSVGPSVQRGVLDGLESYLKSKKITISHVPKILESCSSEQMFVGSYARDLALKVLTQVGADASTTETLLSMLSSPSKAVRSFVVESLSHIKYAVFKDTILSAFSKADEEIKPNIVEICYGAHIYSAAVLEWCVEGSFAADIKTRRASLDYVVTQTTNLNSEQLKRLMTLVSSNDKYVRESAQLVFTTNYFLPDDFCIEMVQKLQHATDTEEKRIRIALHGIHPFSPAIYNQIARTYKSVNNNGKLAILDILGRREKMTHALTHVLLQSLGTVDDSFDRIVLRILESQEISTVDWNILEHYYDSHEERKKSIAAMFAKKMDQMSVQFARKISLQRERDVRRHASSLF